MATLSNGGQVDVVNGYLVVATLPKHDEDGRAVPLGEEVVQSVVALDSVRDVVVTRATRLGDPAGLLVKTDESEVLLYLDLEDALELADKVRPVVHVSDGDDAGSADEGK